MVVLGELGLLLGEHSVGARLSVVAVRRRRAFLEGSAALEAARLVLAADRGEVSEVGVDVAVRRRRRRGDCDAGAGADLGRRGRSGGGSTPAGSPDDLDGLV